MVLDVLVPIIKASRVPSCFVQRQESLQFSTQVARNEEKLGNGTTSSTNPSFWPLDLPLLSASPLNQTRNLPNPYPSRGRYRVTGP
jgi:hypothetical protein